MGLQQEIESIYMIMSNSNERFKNRFSQCDVGYIVPLFNKAIAALNIYHQIRALRESQHVESERFKTLISMSSIMISISIY